ncbi:hypothetical protein MOQ72_32360 [Saccharopolyspora sp. K220]|uniref:hypothetical protein n=1 Tax=Saccharopolyspora soli TaxID=2926618 RepID=UPI001F5637A7|nr:hypothetical protein [Saccharopolyspora soli]MCI2422134.1 hypothetical protein [Saccharopolyspora soli]
MQHVPKLDPTRLAEIEWRHQFTDDLNCAPEVLQVEGQLRVLAGKVEADVELFRTGGRRSSLEQRQEICPHGGERLCDGEELADQAFG